MPLYQRTGKWILGAGVAVWVVGHAPPAKADLGELYVYSPILEGAGVAEIELSGPLYCFFFVDHFF